MFPKLGQKFGWPLPPEIWRLQNIKILPRFRTTSWLERDYLQNATRHCNWKMALQITDTATEADLIWYILVHKWQKIGPEFWPTPTQRAAIRLGIAMHLVLCSVITGIWHMIIIMHYLLSCPYIAIIHNANSWTELIKKLISVCKLEWIIHFPGIEQSLQCLNTWPANGNRIWLKDVLLQQFPTWKTLESSAGLTKSESSISSS